MRIRSFLIFLIVLSFSFTASILSQTASIIVNSQDIVSGSGTKNSPYVLETNVIKWQIGNFGGSGYQSATYEHSIHMSGERSCANQYDDTDMTYTYVNGRQFSFTAYTGLYRLKLEVNGNDMTDVFVNCQVPPVDSYSVPYTPPASNQPPSPDIDIINVISGTGTYGDPYIISGNTVRFKIDDTTDPNGSGDIQYGVLNWAIHMVDTSTHPIYNGPLGETNPNETYLYWDDFDDDEFQWDCSNHLSPVNQYKIILIAIDRHGVRAESNFIHYKCGSGTPQDPYISVSSTSLSFSATQGGGNPPNQSITVTNTGGGTLSWTASEQPTVSWLSLSGISGGSGDQVTVSINISGLSSGTYQDTVRISDSNATNSPVNVPVTLTISTPSPTISVSPTTLSFDANQGGSNPANQTITVTNSGSGTLSWTASEDPGVSWMSLSNISGGHGDQVTVSVTISGINPGIYITNVEISDPNSTNQLVDVPVTLIINPTQTGSLVSGFEAEGSSSLPKSGWQTTTNESKSCLTTLVDSYLAPNVTYRIDYSFNVPTNVSTVFVFAEIDVNGSSVTDSFWFTMNGDTCEWKDLETLGDGWKRAWVFNFGSDIKHGFSVSQGTNTLSLYPRVDGAFINWLVVTTNPNTDIANYQFSASNDPVIAMNPTSLSFSADEGGSNPANQIVIVTNTGGGTLSWTATEQPQVSWLTLSDTTGSSGDTLTVSINITNLSDGTYQDTIHISDSNATNSPVNIPVTLTVNNVAGSILAELQADSSNSLPNSGWQITTNEGERCIKSLINSFTEASDTYRLNYSFDVPSGVDTVYVFAEIDVNGSSGDDSFWIRVNSDIACKWKDLEGLGDGWKREWVYHYGAETQHAFPVSQGTNTLKLYPRADGGYINWFVVTTDPSLDIDNYTFGSGLSKSIAEFLPMEEPKVLVLPGQFKISQNYPNPFNPETTISFDLPEEGHVSFMIFNTLGQKVTELINKSLNAGTHTLVWDGNSSIGKTVNNGVYFGVLSYNRQRQLIKMTLMK